jgi:2-keto-4-pentenoate hydratase/2-oxohepta-3-ene-1,7-dioic acid hydratase in catechol pathway
MKRFYRIEHDRAARYAVEEDGAWQLVEGDIFGDWRRGMVLGPAGHRLLAPVIPSKIVAIGLNYKDHAAEQGKALPAEPMMFLKPPTSVVGPEDAILLPAWAGRIDYEAEVAVVIGRPASQVNEAEALGYVFGLTCLNDVTARDLQKKDVQYTRAKGFDTFGPLGPCIAAGFDLQAPVAIEGWVNGELRQSSSTRELIFGIPRLIAHITAVMTLLPGDIISTGTPAGIGPLHAGDRVTIKVEGVGELTNPVAVRA